MKDKLSEKKIIIVVAIIAVVIFVFLFANENPQLTSPESKQEPEATEKTMPAKPRKITSDIEFQLSTDVELDYNGGFIIKGATNLPEGTKLGFNSMKDGKTNAQNSDVFVTNNSFSAQFGFPIYECDQVEISCYKNEFWQSPDIINQLKFVKSTAWNDDELTTILNVDSVYSSKMFSRLNLTLDYMSGGKIEDIQDYSGMGIKRFVANVIYSEKPYYSQLKKDFDYLVFKVWKAHKDANEIALRCFVGNEKMAFTTRTFSINGLDVFPK